MIAPILRDTIHSQNQAVHTTNAVVMVPPVDFKFNTETSADNEFQKSLALSDVQVRGKALQEFNQMVELLRGHGVNVTVMNYSPSEGETPDAVFPNNWFSTLPNGDLYLFPMACENRRREIRPETLTEALVTSGFNAPVVLEIGSLSSPDAFLESTGVMIMDHTNGTVYAALSVRCDRKLLQEYADRAGFRDVIFFDTQMSSGAPVYHTNVMMAVGEGFAVICDEIIEEFERRRVLGSLQKTKDVVSITEEQMGHFCGNILQLQSDKGERLIAMSLSAYNAFTLEQKRVLRKHGKLVPIDVSTIETIGGGSVRCMLAENFLPQ
ncbi:amidinotransferase [Enterovibrio norvegicus FF-162]|uniref:Amidinotransferase n=1 Tax=Enterovibrio norvegicus FF-454 TaxID=1185651 RepID=A0A1E5C4D1_9GAMM|nr:arginine deiminase-related protein [Enterovibrio norvegicus]OEE60309.1 amidinotransferase [Enterovibrio norvegicus FF-454]OEE86115.1 amidinotransferase [Enterovibrio norvegicus FF-162]